MRAAPWAVALTLLALCGLYPQLAAGLGSLLAFPVGLVLDGAAVLLAQPVIAAAVVALIVLRATRRTA